MWGYSVLTALQELLDMMLMWDLLWALLGRGGLALLLRLVWYSGWGAHALPLQHCSHRLL